MKEWFDAIRPVLVDVGGKILFALAVFLIGRLIIRELMRLLEKGKLMNRASGEVKSFALSFVRIALNVVLLVSVIGILGVPMSSVVAVLASAGVAVGLALQGALSNLAGGIMLMLFKPFRVGDYVEATGAAGTVREITIFYTVFVTADGKRVLVPNGSLMNANVVNCSSEPTRRVDVPFPCARQEDPERVRRLMQKAMTDNALVLESPAPAVHQEPFGEESMNFTARCWCKTKDYWAVYYGLTQAIGDAMTTGGIAQPTHQITGEK